MGKGKRRNTKKKNPRKGKKGNGKGKRRNTNKNPGKGKKMKTNKRNKKKKARAGRKNNIGKRSRQAKRRKEKKIKKTRKQKDRKQNRKKLRQAPNQTSSRCGVEIAQLGQYLPKALSWIQQGKRCETNIKQKTNKAKKKGEFKGQYENALPALGGDDKKPKCKGKDLGKKDNFTVSMETLKKCNTSIKAACEKALPANLNENIKKCNDLAEKYRVDYRKELLKATEDKICENAKKLKTSWAEVEKAC